MYSLRLSACLPKYTVIGAFQPPCTSPVITIHSTALYILFITFELKLPPGLVQSVRATGG